MNKTWIMGHKNEAQPRVCVCVCVVRVWVFACVFSGSVVSDCLQSHGL